MNVSRVLASLQPADFDLRNGDANGIETLYAVGDEIEAKKLSAWFEDVFRFMERLEACDLGSPGPLVHALESIGGYEDALFASLSRKPTPLTLWMLNRIINGAAGADKAELIQKLQACADHDKASEMARQEARDFLEFQARQA